MKKYLVLSLTLPALAFANTKAPAKKEALAWETKDSLKNPESVVFDAASKSYYVSNIDGDGTAKDGNGYISQLDESGKVKNAKWAIGLNAPKGLAVQGNTLWASDIDELVEINIKTGKVKQKIKADGARFLNDVAANGEAVFVSDTLGNKIFVYNGKTIAPLKVKENLESPNGLLLADGKLYVASWGEVSDFSQKPKQLGRLYSLSLDGSKKEILSKSFGNLDGLEKVGDTFVISDWAAGKLYKLSAKGKPELISEGAQGYADLTLVTTDKTVVVLPQMVENKVVAISL